MNSLIEFTKTVPMKDKDFQVTIEYNTIFGIVLLKKALLVANNGHNIASIDFTEFFKNYIDDIFLINAFDKEIVNANMDYER